MSNNNLGRYLYEMIHGSNKDATSWGDLNSRQQGMWENAARGVKRYVPEEDSLFKVVFEGFKRHIKEPPSNNFQNHGAYFESWFTSVVETHVFKQLEHGFEILGMIRQVFPVNIFLSKSGYTLSIKEKNIEACSESLVSAIEHVLHSLHASSLSREHHAFVDTVIEKFKKTYPIQPYEPPQASDAESASFTTSAPKAEGDTSVPSTTPPPDDPSTT